MACNFFLLDRVDPVLWLYHRSVALLPAGRFMGGTSGRSFVRSHRDCLFLRAVSGADEHPLDDREVDRQQGR